MDGLSQNKLIEWLDEFDISSAHMDSQHIDAFAPICPKSQWVEIAFGLYEMSLKSIQERGYPFSVFLALYLNAKKTPSKYTPRKMLYRYMSHQDTPPELYLIKDPSTIKKWQTAGLPLVSLSARYGGKALFDEFYSEDEQQYVRTIFFYKEGGFPLDL